LESGVYEGYEVPVHYDPLIAKVITWGRDRLEAVQRMRRALMEYTIHGIHTTIPFHQRVMVDPEFLRGEIDNTLIDRRFRRTPPCVDESSGTWRWRRLSALTCGRGPCGLAGAGVGARAWAPRVRVCARRPAEFKLKTTTDNRAEMSNFRRRRMGRALESPEEAGHCAVRQGLPR
jgi:hypothetical protein